jgi:BlaI family transcriptional regulator, penicillinase repressor
MPIQISEAEAQVMQVLWERQPLAADEVCAALSGQGWQDATIKTLLNRLLNKGAISAQKDGRRYLYAPLLARDAWLSTESQGFLDRMFNGRLAPLVAHFSQHKALSKADIAELKKLVKDLEHGK